MTPEQVDFWIGAMGTTAVISFLGMVVLMLRILFLSEKIREWEPYIKQLIKGEEMYRELQMEAALRAAQRATPPDPPKTQLRLVHNKDDEHV
jgi:hypothetical protein